MEDAFYKKEKHLDFQQMAPDAYNKQYFSSANSLMERVATIFSLPPQPRFTNLSHSAMITFLLLHCMSTPQITLMHRCLYIFNF